MPEQHKRGILADRWKTIHKQQSKTWPCFLWVSKNSVIPHCPQSWKTKDDTALTVTGPLDPVGSCPSLPLPRCIRPCPSQPPPPHTLYTRTWWPLVFWSPCYQPRGCLHLWFTSCLLSLILPIWSKTKPWWISSEMHLCFTDFYLEDPPHWPWYELLTVL